MIGLLAFAGCTGNPIEAASGVDAEETAPPTGDPLVTTEMPNEDEGATMIPSGSTSNAETSAGGSTAGSIDDTTGETNVCGDAVASVGEWCWFDPSVVGGVTGVGALAVGSLDADADLEIVVIDSVSSPLLVEHGGAGWTVLTITALPAGANSLAIGDLDADGFEDVVSTNAVYGMHTAFGSNVGLVTGQTMTTYGNTGIIALFDGDGDGDEDVAYAWSGTSEVDFYENDAGTLAYWTYAFGTNTMHVDLAVADVDNDGLRDVITAGLPGAFDTYLASAATIPIAAGTDIPDGSSMIAAGDLDEDGWVDLARLVPDADSLSLHRGSAEGFEPPETLPVALDLADVELADLDGDGDLDVVLAGGMELVMYENLGQADLQTRDAIPLALPARRVDLVDLDGNDRVEVILRGPQGLEVVRANP